MKKILLVACGSWLAAFFSNAQQTQGLVIYERTSQMNIQFAGNNPEMERMIPRSRTDKFDLVFGNNKSLWKQAEQENNDDTEFDGGGMQIRMIAAGANDVLFCDFENAKSVEQRELFDKKFIVDDSIRKLQWKLTDETKTILNHLCRKAIATRYSTRMMMNMDNGKMERKEVADTSLIIAWFTMDIPVSAGPGEYQGQLPGLILEMNINDGRQTFIAKSISDKADLAVIKEPTGKKRYTQAEFRKERDKMMEEMQRNNQGGNRVIRMN